jgi:pseudaminic acid cytidylyltransferase
MMNNLAIIPARGGSKRILGKNIKNFLGKPIISYSIETALESGLFSEVMVSTDDEKIAEIAVKAGAKVPFLRSPKNADDYATTVDVLEEVLGKYSKFEEKYDYACCIYPTAPFIRKDMLENSLRLLQQDQLDCVFPVVPFSYPVQRAVRMSGNKTFMVWPDHLKSRSQDLERYFHDAGLFYFFHVPTFIVKKQLWSDNTGSIELSELEVQDIDSDIDWKIAEMKFKILHGN